MPVRPENAHLYTDDWPERAHAAKEAAGWRCTCTGECGRALSHLHPTDGRCRNVHGERKWGNHKRQSIATVAAAHRNHDPRDNRPENIVVYCDGCHVVHDNAHHWHTRREREYQEMGILPLFDLDTLAPTDDEEPACV